MYNLTDSTRQRRQQNSWESTEAPCTDTHSKVSSGAISEGATEERCGEGVNCSEPGTSSHKPSTMKVKVLYSIYGVGLLTFVGCGWSLAENFATWKAIVLVVCFIALYLGAKVINRYAEIR